MIEGDPPLKSVADGAFHRSSTRFIADAYCGLIGIGAAERVNAARDAVYLPGGEVGDESIQGPPRAGRPLAGRGRMRTSNVTQ
jgi:hypothetical protein